MNLQQLEYIVALNKHRHFGRAADSCNVSQPTMSTMVQKLEDELGVKLFERSRSAVTPTNIGLKVIQQAEITLHQSSLLSWQKRISWSRKQCPSSRSHKR